MMSHLSRAVTTVSLVFALAMSVSADATRALPEGQLPNDARLKPLKDLNGYFPFQPSQSLEQWEERAGELRRQILVSLGLWPLPTKAPLNAVVHGKQDMGDYTVEKAYFESMPGFFVTGSLYRPKKAKGEMPGVLCPHGHWSQGRFYKRSPAEVGREINAGAEQFERGGSSHLQARCVQLARMGCVVFFYDMIGYADCTQISFDIAHRFAKQRPEMNSPDNWGLFSPQAESHNQSVMGLQTYNSIRALDFLSELPDVDDQRLAVTGASGGGTQTFMLCAVDPRPVACFPAVMVSTAMQGGCTCENACSVRVGTGNVEFAALFAPKPLLLSAADDWTKEMLTKGFPDLLQHYSLYGAPYNVTLLSRTEFGHNYNSVSRHAMYHWFNRHLDLGIEEPIKERDFEPQRAEDLTVWSGQHEKPAGGDEFERELLRWWHEDSQSQLAKLDPTGEKSLADFDTIVGGAVKAVIGRELPDAKEVTFEHTSEGERDGHHYAFGLLRNATHGEELPMAFLHPSDWQGRVVIWLSTAGKAALFNNDGQPNSEVEQLLDAGVSVVGVDLLYQGEFLADGKSLERTGRVANTREAAAYTFGYNHSVFAKRVHDVLSVVTFVKNHEAEPTSVELLAIDGAGAWAAAAAAQAGDVLNRVAIDTRGFRFGNVTDIHSPDFLPGGAKYGDLPGMLAVARTKQLWLAGEANAPLIRQAHKSRGTKLVTSDDTSDKASKHALTWLLAN